MENFIPAIITASVALIAATGAQILSHILTARRSRREKERDIYQEFIFPFLSKVLLYYSTETNFRKLHDIEKAVDLDNLINDISSKVSYGNLKLLSCQYEIEKTDHFFDGRGGSKERNVLRFLFWFLDYCYEVISNMKDVEDNVHEKMLKEIIEKQKLYGIWILVSEEYHLPYSDDVIEFMKYDFFYFDLIPEYSIGLIRELVDTEPGVDRRRLDFLNRLINHVDIKHANLEIVSRYKEHYKFSMQYNVIDNE